jgi:hypothetical protein
MGLSHVMSRDIDGGTVPDILIRVPEDVIAATDIKAQRVGLPRTEYLRRALAREREAQSAGVSVADPFRLSWPMAGRQRGRKARRLS